ncbi:serine/threonine protein kinase [Streptomyces sp. RPA4-5]|uniref:protein kinase family protein n=1 Tax=unclassified Streptomyces TaxID=2593676 RepID=UPI00143EC9D8|nr:MULTISPECIES: protein kinase family protein [unclassified Streptomyces]QIY56517.1 serine/threonine protein kinase [Streptomyces sp. RPA4-5]WJY39408.1 protein kinase family protein [Streptomyces sp. P9-2B-2]
MAERSTAAVDVADTSGEEPLTAKAGKATDDGAKAEKVSGREQDAAGTDEERAEAIEAQPPELHSGHKLARRYRLEECVTRLDGFSSWRAVDEKLRRAVGVHILPADHPRGRPVLSAARSSALLGDPRFVQVLDAVEENDLVYVVHEWLPDATELTTVLANGPLEPHDAYQLVSQVSQAMAAAHREGLSHLRITPGSVLRTESGQYRIRGLAVMAALRGITCESPQRADTEAIGALLYAALTQRWPYENDAHGLTGLPKGVGLIAPDQVRAGVHRGLSELAMRALINDGATASRQEPACTTPEELAKAVAAMPRIRPPETTFSTPPPYQRTGYQQGSYRQSSGAAQATRATQPVPTPPPPLQSRTGRALKWSVSALLITALGLGSWQLADTLLKREKDQDAPGNSQPAGGPKKHTGKALSVKGATEFSPLAEPFKEEDAHNVTDGSPSTAWVTGRFKGWPNFGNLPTRADGSGIIVDLGSTKDISGIQATMYRPGQTVEIRAAASSAANPTTLGDFSQRISKLGEAGDKLDVKLDQSVKSRYVLVHITKLASDGASDWFRGGISEIKIFS